MGAWDCYAARIDSIGGDRRNTVKDREMRFLRTKLPRSLSYHHAVVDGEERELAVINSDTLNIKTICSMPGEDIRHGSLVDWAGYHWLVTEKDVNTELYAKAIMEQCNYLIRWVAFDGTVQERWCIIEDGTKLRRTTRRSLAHWKRCVKTIPLIAGNHLRAA